MSSEGTAQAAPVGQADRIASLDVMRGLAVLGILAVNAASFAFPFSLTAPEGSPFAPTQAAELSEWVVATFFKTKFITLFTLLFGASLFLVGGDRSDPTRNRLIVRRLGWLAVIGLLHGLLIWYGDILLFYALLGLVVMLLRGWSPRRLILTGSVLALVLGLASAGTSLALHHAPAEIRAAMEPPGAAAQETLRAAVAVYKSGWAGVYSQNAIAWVTLQLAGLLGYGLPSFAVMTLGLGLFKAGFLSGRAPVWVYGLVAAVGLSMLALLGWTGWLELHDISTGGWNGALESFPIVISLGYASVLILALKLGGRRLVGWLAPVGQMAFTNYLTQSIIMATLFYMPFGPGLMGQVDRPGFWPIIAGVWAAQILWSTVWLMAFRMGPMEWAWRCLTYGRLLPLMR